MWTVFIVSAQTGGYCGECYGRCSERKNIRLATHKGIQWDMVELRKTRMNLRKFYDYFRCYAYSPDVYVTVLNNSPCTSTHANTSPSPEVLDPYNALCTHSSAYQLSSSRD